MYSFPCTRRASRVAGILISESMLMVLFVCTSPLWITACCIFFFFFKQKTAYEMRISDWSSDVCSSDLVDSGVASNYSLAFADVSVRGPGKAARLDGVIIAPGTFADAIAITGSHFTDMATIVVGTGEQEPKGTRKSGV